MQMYRENRIAARLIVETIRPLIRKNGRKSDHYLSSADCVLWDHRQLRMAVFDKDARAALDEEPYCNLDIRTFDNVKVLCVYSDSHDVHMFQGVRWLEVLAQIALEEGGFVGAALGLKNYPGAFIEALQDVVRTDSA